MLVWSQGYRTSSSTWLVGLRRLSGHGTTALQMPGQTTLVTLDQKNQAWEKWSPWTRLSEPFAIRWRKPAWLAFSPTQTGKGTALKTKEDGSATYAPWIVPHLINPILLLPLAKTDDRKRLEKDFPIFQRGKEFYFTGTAKLHCEPDVFFQSPNSLAQTHFPFQGTPLRYSSYMSQWILGKQHWHYPPTEDTVWTSSSQLCLVLVSKRNKALKPFSRTCQLPNKGFPHSLKRLTTTDKNPVYLLCGPRLISFLFLNRLIVNWVTLLVFSLNLFLFKEPTVDSYKI